MIFRRHGLASFTPIVLKVPDSMAVAARAAQEIVTHNPDAVFVDGSGGYGARVIDRCRQLGYAPVEVQFGGRAGDALREQAHEMAWRMAESG